MLNVKRLFAFVVVACLIGSAFGENVFADSRQFVIGDYFIIGQYNGIPILWRYAADDDNGMLVISDKIISFKNFSSKNNNFWKESRIRTWLNSSALEGQVMSVDGESIYNGEAGFLSDDNFTQSELNLMKPITQWTMLPADKLELSENGLDDYYIWYKEPPSGYGTGRDEPSNPGKRWELSDFPNAYFGAAYQLEDTVFLLDEMQLYRVWENFGNVDAIRTDESKPEEENDGQSQAYLLRTPILGTNVARWDKDNYMNYPANYVVANSRDWKNGIRPAFYLNELVVGNSTGSGAENDPYVLAVDPNYISVKVNGKTLSFDVPPMMENDRVMVPMRKIFEELGADVQWFENEQRIFASKGNEYGGRTLSLWIGNPQMSGSTYVMYPMGAVTEKLIDVKLDVPPRLVNGRTLVPVRAISEGLGATVEWDEINNQAIITTE